MTYFIAVYKHYKRLGVNAKRSTKESSLQNAKIQENTFIRYTRIQFKRETNLQESNAN